MFASVGSKLTLWLNRGVRDVEIVWQGKVKPQPYVLIHALSDGIAAHPEDDPADLRLYPLSAIHSIKIKPAPEAETKE